MFPLMCASAASHVRLGLLLLSLPKAPCNPSLACKTNYSIHRLDLVSPVFGAGGARLLWTKKPIAIALGGSIRLQCGKAPAGNALGNFRPLPLAHTAAPLPCPSLACRVLKMSAKSASHATFRQRQYMAMAKEMPLSYLPSLKTGYRKVSYPDSDKTGESNVSGSPHSSPGSVSHSLPSILPPLSPTAVPQANPASNSENSKLKTGIPVVSEDNDKQAKVDPVADLGVSADAADAKEWQDFLAWQRRILLLRAAFEKATDEEEATKLRTQWVLELVTKETAVYDEWMSEFNVFTSCQDVIKEVKTLLPGEHASWKVTTRTYYTVRSWLKTTKGLNVDLRSSFFKKPGTRVGILEIAPGSLAHQDPAFFLSGPFNRACRASPTSKKAVLMWTCDDQILGRVLYGDKRPDGMLTSVVIKETAHLQSAERAALKMRLIVIKDHKLVPDVESTLRTGIIWEILEERRMALEDLRVIEGVDYGDIYNQLKGDLFSTLIVQDPNHPNSVDLNHRQVWFGATRVRVHFYDLRGDPQLANPPEIYNIVDNDPNSETNLAFVQKTPVPVGEKVAHIPLLVTPPLRGIYSENLIMPLLLPKKATNQENPTVLFARQRDTLIRKLTWKQSKQGGNLLNLKAAQSMDVASMGSIYELNNIQLL
ncbi:hypothetical protein BV25DRAFT_1983545 [Artomyces pyxidatus]|uniref:Uncharacterized protein n=1 Tax=Artomyces pyxidatus TaxID=48021 RepID=A0ACB8SHV8_9AGAM|nr:hypothetical protein BV25DRAFT_1983545 [Artomyces pyxidatus]